MRPTLRSFLPLLFLCLAGAASAQAPCKRGFAVPEPFIVNTDADWEAVFGDVDGDGRPDPILRYYGKDFVFVNRGGVHSWASTLNHRSYDDYLAAVHDQNGDGKRDFVYAERASKRWVLFGNGDGTHGEPVETTLPPFPGVIWTFTVDIDGDQRIDFIELRDDGIRFLRGMSDGGFVEAGTYPIAKHYGTWGPVIGDFDGDGAPDVATFVPTVGLSGMIHIHWASRSFGLTGPSMNQGRLPETLVAADLEGDGTSEIIGFLENELFVVRAGDRSVRPERIVLPPGTGSVVLHAAGVTDFDGDGHRDLIAAGFTAVYVFRGTASGTWRSPDVYPLSGAPCLQIMDFDADGRDDLVSTCNSLEVLYGGRPAASPAFRTTGGTRNVRVTDQNRDGIADLLVTHASFGTEFKLGAADGTFSTSWSMQFTGFSTVPSWNVLTDLDQDDVPDLVLRLSDINQVFFGTANGFSTSSLTLPEGVVVGAWTTEGKSVLVMRNGLSLQTVAISPAHETTVTPLPPLPKDGWVQTVQADTDPELELIVSSPFAQLWHHSAGGWTAGESLGGTAEGGVVSGDLNADGRPDFVLWDSSGFDIALTDGASYRRGQIVPFDHYALQHGVPHSASIGDFDKDGRNDILLTTERSFSVARNLGDGTFEPYSVFAGGMMGGVFLDADRDGWLDAIGLGEGGVHVVRNVCAPPRVRMTVTPSVLREGDRATIHVQSLALIPLGLDILHNGALAPGELSEFQTRSWTTPPLAAGQHTFSAQVFDGMSVADAVEIKVRVAPPGARRRIVRH